MNSLAKLSDKKILVTGGAGFIGSNIVDYLMEINHPDVVVMDNLETGNINNIETYIRSGKIKFIQDDIRNFGACLKATENCDIVLHQAALGSVPRSIERPLETHATNVNGFINILEASRQNNVSRVIYASSSSVYGDDLSLPKIEEKVGNPLSPYAVSKKTNELYARVFSELYSMEITGLRYFNVFGPKQNPKGPYAAVIPIFINRLLNNETCVIYGDGLNKRDFTYVSNVVQANLLAAVTPAKNINKQVFNVAFGSTETVQQLYTIIQQKLSVDILPQYNSPRPGEIKDSFADIGKISAAMGYKPMVSLLDGIEKTINWYKQNRI